MIKKEIKLDSKKVLGSKDTIFDGIDEMSSTGVFIFGVELFFYSLLILFHDFELFFRGVFHSFVLILEEVFEINVTFFDL